MAPWSMPQSAVVLAPFLPERKVRRSLKAEEFDGGAG